MPDDLPRYLTRHEAALFLRMTDRKLTDNYRRWGIPATKAGRSLLFLEADLLAWLSSRRVTAA